MKKTEILVICTHQDILATIIRLIKNNETYNAIGVSNITEANEMIDSGKFDLVLLGSGLTEAEENNFFEHSKTIPVVRHYGGGSGLLFAEIFEALKLTT